MHRNANVRPKVRRVALLAMDRLDRDALCYALNACERLDARLDVLTNLPSAETDRSVLEARGTADTPWKICRIDGVCGDDILRYTRNEAGLLFLTSSADDAKACRLRERFGPSRMRMGISWVIVESRKIRR